MYTTWWGQLLGEVLLVGALSMGIVYAAVRVVVYMSAEFDERLDGIIYGMAAALGIATVVNFQYVLRHGGVDLDIGSIRMVVNAMGYACFGGVLGYFMGQARFEKTPAYYVPGGPGVCRPADWAVLLPDSTALPAIRLATTAGVTCCWPLSWPCSPCCC